MGPRRGRAEMAATENFKIVEGSFRPGRSLRPFLRLTSFGESRAGRYRQALNQLLRVGMLRRGEYLLDSPGLDHFAGVEDGRAMAERSQ
jgi:hypothetical protein